MERLSRLIYILILRQFRYFIAVLLLISISACSKRYLTGELDYSSVASLKATVNQSIDLSGYLVDGIEPFTYELQSGSGTLDATTGEFIPDSAAESIVKVTDYVGTELTLTISGYDAVTISENTWVAKDSSIDVSSYFSGGLAPYTYSIAETGNGDGTLFSSVLTGTIGGLVNVTITDSIGSSATMGITVAETNILNSSFSGGSASIVEIAATGGNTVYDDGLLVGCETYWQPQATLCDEHAGTNLADESVRTRDSAGATWDNVGMGEGILVIDLGSEQSFSLLSLFQMYEDGKYTGVQFFSHTETSGTPPAYSDGGWTAISSVTTVGAGSYSFPGGFSTVTDPTYIAFSELQTTRYLKVVITNDGTHGDVWYTEIRSIKAF